MYIVYLMYIKNLTKLNPYIIYLAAGTPSLYGAGYAKSDFTTCLTDPGKGAGARLAA